MNKTQKIIILIAIFVILFLIIYPPHLKMSSFAIRGVRGNEIMDIGRDWLFNLKGEKSSGEGYWTTTYYRIRFDILICEIFAIGILACFFIVLTKKIDKRGEK